MTQFWEQEELVDKEHANYTLSINSVAICCKLSELENELAKTESEPYFYKWVKTPLEQLDHIIGGMVKPGEDKIPPVMLYYLSLPLGSKPKQHDHP